MLDQAGTWLFIITGKVSGSHGFQGPYGLALDPQGNIHVAAVMVLTPSKSSHLRGPASDHMGMSRVHPE